MREPTKLHAKKLSGVLSNEQGNRQVDWAYENTVLAFRGFVWWGGFGLELGLCIYQKLRLSGRQG